MQGTVTPPLVQSWTDITGWFSLAEGTHWQSLCTGKNVLELGRHQGRSTACAAQVAQQVMSIDRSPDNRAHYVLSTLKLRDRAILLTGRFSEVIPQLPQKPTFDVVLIDGGHTAEEIGRDTRLVLPLLQEDAILGFHDYDNIHDPRAQFPDVKPAVDALAALLNWGAISVVGVLATFKRTKLV